MDGQLGREDRTLTGCDVFGVLVEADGEAFGLPDLVFEDAALWIEVVLDVSPPENG